MTKQEKTDNNLSSMIYEDYKNREDNLKQLFKGYSNNNQMPEEVFVEKFLPYFAGYFNNQANELLVHWWTVAGNLFKEVDLIDSLGNVLKVVPPLIDRNVLSSEPVNKAGILPIDAVIDNIRNTGTNLPVVAASKEYAELQARYSRKLANKASPELQKRWIDFLKSYNIEPITGIEEKNKTNTTISDMLDMDYGD